MTATAASVACANHPERPPVARCVACETLVCSACATRWEGIHFCVSCLARRRESERSSSPVIGWVATVALTLLLAAVATLARPWLAAVWGELW